MTHGNKWAASIGFTAKDFCTTSSICFSFNTEYTRVEPGFIPTIKEQDILIPITKLIRPDLALNSQELYTRLDAEWNFLQLTSEVRCDQDTLGGNLYDIHTP